MSVIPPNKDIQIKYIHFNSIEEKIIIAMLHGRDDVQNKYSDRFDNTYLSDHIQHIRAKLERYFNLSHKFVKDKVLYNDKIEGSRREIFRIALEWQSKIKPLLKTIQDES